jgi:uncharacterized protein YndB with AHSA1/START domain
MTESTAGEALTETTDTTVTVSRVVSCTAKNFWKALVSREGTDSLMGEGAILGSKGESWRAADGTFGVIRTYHPNEQVRFTWHANDDAPATLVDLRLIPVGEGTRLELHHENLPGGTDIDGLAARWNDVLDLLSGLSCSGA